MSDIFEGYERQYCELSTNLSRKCGNAALLTGEQKKQKLLELKNGVDEAESLIRRMDLEARSLPPTQKATLLAKLREYKSDLNNLKREVKKSSSATSDAAASRDELMEGGMSDKLGASSDQRGRLLASTDRLQQTGDRIKESKRTLLETEELGVSILQDLATQRQTLLHARDTLHNVDDNISKSRNILNSMTRRMQKNKLMMGGIVAVLIAAIILIIYVKLKAK
eukprot:TRINITY_DN20877_c0_g1_i1.p1 TRINITY_DN20877_c0_g1~~TRINITY_DN20877_c0_g1_i1.p1  ORF type:complete len:224 (-),score=51.91 TRINITY_DN20877_c0_g1_i1:412-1083(-)